MNIENTVFIIKDAYNYQSLLMDTKSIIKVDYNDCIFRLINYAEFNEQRFILLYI